MLAGVFVVSRFGPYIHMIPGKKDAKMIDERKSVNGRRIYYGWLIVLVTFLSSMISAGLTGYGLAFFIIPMSRALNVSRAAFSAVTLFRLAALPLIPFLGILVDKRHGARILMTVGSIVAGTTLILIYGVSNIWQFYFLYGIVFGLATTAIGGMVIEPALIAKWFIKYRGRAMAIGTMGISAGGVIIAPWAGWLVGSVGWELAWVGLGMTIFMCLTLPAFVLIRRSPEDIGLYPDNISPVGTTEGDVTRSLRETDNTASEYSWTVGQAAGTRAFWLLLGVNILGLVGLMPAIINQVAYAQDKGFSMITATSMATVVALCAMIGKLPWGYWAENKSLTWLISLCCLTSGMSLFVLIVADNTSGLFLYAVFHGLTMGGFPTLMNVVWAGFFGRANAGAIRGVITPPVTFMGFLSPAVAGWMWDRWGSYDIAFLFFVLAWILAGLLMLMVKQPAEP